MDFNAPFHRVVRTMMARFSAPATLLSPSEGGTYVDSEWIPNSDSTYEVRVIVFDYLRKTEGLSTEPNTLIRSGDKQVFVQPINRTNPDLVMPKIQPGKDTMKIGTTTYKIVAVKDYNPSTQDSILIELYVRE